MEKLNESYPQVQPTQYFYQQPQVNQELVKQIINQPVFDELQLDKLEA